MRSYLQLVCQEAVRNSAAQAELRKSVTRRHPRAYQVMEIVTATAILLQETLLEPYSVTSIYLVSTKSIFMMLGFFEELIFVHLIKKCLSFKELE
jgi:hypothetical protein